MATPATVDAAPNTKYQVVEFLAKPVLPHLKGGQLVYTGPADAFMAGDTLWLATRDGVERLTEGGQVERAGNAVGQADIQQRTGRVGGLYEPHPELTVGQPV